MAERLLPDNKFDKRDIPDSVKTVEWWRLQNGINEAAKSGDVVREIKLLNRQTRLARELKKKADKLKKEGKL